MRALRIEMLAGGLASISMLPEPATLFGNSRGVVDLWLEGVLLGNF